MVKVNDISAYINELAPYDTQCSWDNCGLLVGDGNAEVKKVGLCLDLTEETFENAKKYGSDLIITHHPAIFSPQKSFLAESLIYKASVSGVAVISAHTCFDCAKGGVNDVLCGLLGLSDIKSVQSNECTVPMVRIGKTGNEYTPEEFAKIVSQKLGTVVRLVDAGQKINSVAVCGGAGMDFICDAIRDGADAFVTGEIKHHEMLFAKEKGITVICAGHFETEYPAMTALKNKLSEKFNSTEFGVLEQSNPIKFIYK